VSVSEPTQFLRLVATPDDANSVDTASDDGFDYTTIDPHEPSLDALLAQEAEVRARAIAAAQPPDDDTLPLDAIQVRPEDNVSRGGTMDGPTHPRVQLIAASLTSVDCGRLLEGLGLEVLAAPVPRPCGAYGHQPGERPCCPPGAVGVHTHRLRYGFRRIVALRLANIAALHRSKGNVVLHEGATERQLDTMGGIENMLRDDPTHMQLGLFCVREIQTHRMTLDEIVAATGFRAPAIESYMRMVQRLPPDLLQVWRMRETPQVERALTRIASLDLQGTVHLDNVEARHAQMRAEWALVEATWAREEAARAAAAAAVPPAKLFPSLGEAGGERRTVRKRLRAMAIEIDGAREVWDPAVGGWRPLDDRERGLLRAVLAQLQAPTGASLFRR
jgi:hypothetical protein